jgi:hypothetical protein
MEKVEEDLRLKATHQLLTYAEDVNVVGENIDAIKKNTETLLYASKEVGYVVRS